MNLLARDTLVELHIAVFRDAGYRVSGSAACSTKLLPRTPATVITCTAALLAAVEDWAAQHGCALHLNIQEALTAELAKLATRREDRTVWYG